MKILIVEDNQKIATTLKKGLEHEGYVVDIVHDGEQGYRRLLIEKDAYNLVLLDIMLPTKDGISICTDWRKEGVLTPVLMLTARDATGDKVLGLDAGADDYLVKPFEFVELLARIRALLRRPHVLEQDVLTLGVFVLDPKKQQITLGGKVLHLTLQEYRVLEYLLHHPDQVISREQLLSAVWDFAFTGMSNVVDVHIRNIRLKLHKYENTITTIRGVGYKLEV